MRQKWGAQSAFTRQATHVCGVCDRSHRPVGEVQFASLWHCLTWQVLSLAQAAPLGHCVVSTHCTQAPGWPGTPDGLQCCALGLPLHCKSLVHAPLSTQVCCAEQAKPAGQSPSLRQPTQLPVETWQTGVGLLQSPSA